MGHSIFPVCSVLAGRDPASSRNCVTFAGWGPTTDSGTVSGSEDTCPPRSRLSHQAMVLQPSKSLDERCLGRKRLPCPPLKPHKPSSTSSGC